MMQFKEVKQHMQGAVKTAKTTKHTREGKSLCSLESLWAAFAHIEVLKICCVTAEGVF